MFLLDWGPPSPPPPPSPPNFKRSSSFKSTVTRGKESRPPSERPPFPSLRCIRSRSRDAFLLGKSSAPPPAGVAAGPGGGGRLGPCGGGRGAGAGVGVSRGLLWAGSRRGGGGCRRAGAVRRRGRGAATGAALGGPGGPGGGVRAPRGRGRSGILGEARREGGTAVPESPRPRRASSETPR